MSAIRNCTVYLRNAAILNIDAVIQDWYKNDLHAEFFGALEGCDGLAEYLYSQDPSEPCEIRLSLIDDICDDLEGEFAERVVKEYGPDAVFAAFGYSADQIIKFRNESPNEQQYIDDAIAELWGSLPAGHEIIEAAGISYAEIDEWASMYASDLWSVAAADSELRSWASSQGYN